MQEPEGDRMTAATKYGSPRKLPCGDRSARRTRFPWGEAGVLGEGMDKCSRGARRGMGPSTCTRVAEIMSGRAIPQQGLATTCKDPAHNGNTRGAGRGVVWRMSPYERRRGGNAPPGGLEAAPARVTPALGKGALGTRWPRQWVRTRRRAGSCGACIVAKGRCKLHRVGAKGAPAPQFRAVGEGPP